MPKFLYKEWQLMLGLVGQDPRDSKSNRLHVDIFRFSFIHCMKYIAPQIPLKRSVILLKSPTSTGYFSNSIGSFAINRRISPSPAASANFQLVLSKTSRIGDTKYDILCSAYFINFLMNVYIIFN